MPLTIDGRKLWVSAVKEYRAIADLLRQAETRLEHLDGRLDGWYLNRNRRTGRKISDAEDACRAMAHSMYLEIEESDREDAEEDCDCPKDAVDHPPS